MIGSTNLGQKFKYNGVELNEDLGLYEMPFRQYNPEIARFTSVDPVTHFDFSTYNAFDNNPAFWADPSGANAGTTTGTTVNLEEVVVTAPSKRENVPAWFYGSTSWTSDYKGNLQDYNSEFGTNYTYGDAINPYNQWMYEHFYKPQYDDMISSMHEATSMAAELTLYVLPTPLAVAGSLRALPALGTGLVRFNKVANTASIRLVVEGNTRLHAMKSFVIKNSYKGYKQLPRGVRKQVYPLQNLLNKEQKVWISNKIW